MRSRYLPTLAACLLLAGTAHAAAPVRSLPGPDGGWDYARVDSATERLYVARSNSVSVFDLTGKASPRSIGSIAHGHAALPIAGTTTLLVTSGADASVRLLDTGDGREIARVPVGDDPDGAAIDDATGRAYVMNAKAGTVSVIDLKARRVVATVSLKPGLEFPALGDDGTLFVNNEDANEIETVDTRTMAAGVSIALPGCEGPSGLAFDKRTGILISACANGKAAIVDARTRTVKTLLPIGDGPDAVLIDAKRRRAYIPCGRSGDLIVIALDGDAGPHVTGRVPTASGARTAAFDPRDGTVYLPTAQIGPPPAPGKRGAPIAGTFHVVIVPAPR